jgi:hypothetical protein
MRAVRSSLACPLAAALASVCACGGGTSDQGNAKTPAGPKEDKDFAAYVAAHGIQTLEGGGSATEVTADGLRLEAYQKDRPVKLDGVLDEWPAPAKATVITGSTKSGLKIGLQYDEGKLYVGGDITDAAFVAGKDHVSLVLAVPTPAATYAVYDLGFYPGKPGDTEGTVRLGRRGTLAGAKIIEAPGGNGITFEATVPWSSLPEARSTRVGIHGIATYVDGDGTVATGPGDAAHPHDMPWVPSEPELALIEQLLSPKGYTKRAPDVELVADLVGDGHRERVAVWDHALTITGASYLGGTGYFFRDLPGELVKLEARDVTGRRGTDVVVRRKQSVGEAEREYLEVLSALSASAEPVLTFVHEIAIRKSDKHIDNAVRLGRGVIEVSTESSTTWDALSYKEPIASDVEPILFPWGGVRAQTYKFDGAKFSKAKELAQRDQTPGTFVTSSGGPSGGGGGDSAPALAHPPEPPTPKVSRGGDLGAQVLDLYRKDRGVSASVAPKVDLRVQLTGDSKPERVLLMGRDIVVLGPGIKGGTAYAYITLQQFASDGDIDDLSARDLTGDGNADLVVRGTRHVKSDAGAVDEETLFAYQIAGDGISRIFGIETGREMGGKRIQGLVQFIPSANGKSFDILAAPGRATGWTERTYPFTQDPPGSGSLEPLLLPWGGISSIRYTWNGSAFVAQRSGG